LGGGGKTTEGKGGGGGGGRKREGKGRGEGGREKRDMGSCYKRRKGVRESRKGKVWGSETTARSGEGGAESRNSL